MSVPLTIATTDYDHSAISASAWCGPKASSQLAHARPSRDFFALHLQSRMGRLRTILRQIHGAGDTGGLRHHRFAGLCLAAVPFCLLLREPQSRNQDARKDLRRQTHRRAGMGAHRGRLYARLADARRRRRARRDRMGQAGTNEAGRIEKVELSLPKGVQLTSVPEKTLSGMIASGELDCVIIARPPNSLPAKNILTWCGCFPITN